jgi:hypothetical protein
MGSMPFRDSEVRATSRMDHDFSSGLFELKTQNNATLSKTLVRESLDLEHLVFGGPSTQQPTSCWKAWSLVEASSLQSSLVPARSPRNHKAFASAIENDELLRQGPDYWTDDKINNIEAGVWSAPLRPPDSIITTSCVGPMESEVEGEEALSTLGHREGLRIAGITCPMVSFQCLGVRSHWKTQPVGHTWWISS